MKKQLLLPGIAILNAALLLLQAFVMHGTPVEVTRYFEQGVILFVPLMVWMTLKVRFGKWILRICIMLLAIVFFGTAVKRIVPGSRRYAQLQACEWVGEIIRDNWKGPQFDKTNAFSIREYHRPNRPVVDAQDARMVFLSGGRSGSEDNRNVFGDVDTPDYIACTAENFKAPSELSYEKIAERAFGGRRFVVYGRVR